MGWPSAAAAEVVEAEAEAEVAAGVSVNSEFLNPRVSPKVCL